MDNFLIILSKLLNSNLVPDEDVQDLENGADWIPGEVTEVRRKGIKVKYDSIKKEWLFPDNKIIRG